MFFNIHHPEMNLLLKYLRDFVDWTKTCIRTMHCPLIPQSPLYSSTYILHSFLPYIYSEFLIYFMILLMYKVYSFPPTEYILVFSVQLPPPFTNNFRNRTKYEPQNIIYQEPKDWFLCMSCSYSLCFKSDANYIRKNNINHMFFILVISPFFPSCKFCCSFLDYGTKGSWWYH